MYDQHQIVCYQEDLARLIKYLAFNDNHLDDEDRDILSRNIIPRFHKGDMNSEEIEYVLSLFDTVEHKSPTKPDFELEVVEKMDMDGSFVFEVMLLEKKKPRAKSKKEIFKKVKGTEFVVLKDRINFSSDLLQNNHPILDELMNKVNGDIEEFSNKLREHILELENTYPQYEDFTYEFDQDRNGSWYVLKGRGVE